jgi:hypothetical protein
LGAEVVVVAEVVLALLALVVLPLQPIEAAMPITMARVRSVFTG